MDINFFAVLSICTIFGAWRVYDYYRQRSRQELLRERVAWMLWMAADRTQVQ